MRIWIINHYAAPPSMAGGTRHYNFARQLIKRGHEVTLIASNYNHFSHTFIHTNESRALTDYSYEVPFVWIPTPAYRGNTLARFRNMLSFSWKILFKSYLCRSEPPDLIIGSSPHLFAAMSAEFLSRRLKVPFILEVRDLWPESLIDLGRLSPKHPLILLMRGIERYLYKRAQRIISLLPSVDQYLINQGVSPRNILWLPNAIDTDLIPQDLQRVPSDQFTVLYAGAFGLANDLDTVLQAAKILETRGFKNKIRISLIGSGPEKLHLQELAKQLDLSLLEFLEPVSKKDIYPILNQADAFLMLLKDSPVFRWGISPNKLFDYLAMSRPILFGVNTAYNPIEKYQAGLTVKPSNPEELAEAIQKLASLSRDERAAMGERGKQFVLQHHHLQGLTDSLEDLLLKTQAQSKLVPVTS